MSEKENEAEAWAKSLAISEVENVASALTGQTGRHAASLLRSQAERIRELEGDREEAIGRLGSLSNAAGHFMSTINEMDEEALRASNKAALVFMDRIMSGPASPAAPRSVEPHTAHPPASCGAEADGG